jgi:endogenous inhibitor of DNA gyrase (YacG/DUF329 family)
VSKLERLEVACTQCDYEVDLLVGTQSPRQTFSDLNEDFAYYKLFLCPKGNDIQSIDVHFREFDGGCPEHGVELQPLTDMPRDCPKCGESVQVMRNRVV